MKNKSKKRVEKVNFFSLKFPSYLTSHSKPQNVRKYIANKERLKKMDKVSFSAWGKPKEIPKKDLTWPQAKIRYPLLRPMRDTDKDGVINLLDCRPFDRRRQHFNKKQTLFEKAEEGTLTPKDIEEHELKAFKKDCEQKEIRKKENNIKW